MVLKNCKTCRKKFKVRKRNDVKKGHSKFCSRECYWKSLKGKTSWNKGLPAPWARNNPQTFKKGNIPKHAGKKREEMRGKKHWNWKGGKEQRPIVRIEYKNWRKKVFERDNYTCQFCKKRGGYLEADHIELWSKCKSKRYLINNGRTLCRQCHIKRHRKQ